ncbi:MAG: MMPL family transporter [Solirubrobacteraceae bacterium]|nr:MMPL family transporter [Solirubrobacteraceae bacterium]
MPQTRDNLALRAGRWSARHRRTAILGWLAFVAIALVLGGAIGTRMLEDDSGSGSSGRAERALDAHFPDTAQEAILVQSRDGSLTAADPAFREAVRDVERRLDALPEIASVESPLDGGHGDRVSEDGRSALIQAEMAGDAEEAEDHVQPVLDAVAAAQRAHPQLRIEQFGDASADRALSERFEEDFRQAELLSLPITLLILVVAFGALVAAGLPVLLALTSVGAALGLVAIPSQIWPVDEAVSSVILLIGMAVGVDYSLFYMRREREEREKGRDERSALLVAAATSGRAVLVSGMTVMIAMAGMYLSGSDIFTGMATGTLIVVGVAMLGSVTVLPAMLAWLGDRVNTGRVPLVHRLRRPGEDPRAWSWVLDRVLRRPWLSAIAATALLVLMAIPAFGLKLVLPGAEGLPRDMAVMQTYDRIQAAFPGGPTPAVVVVEADDVRSPQMTRAIADLREQVLAADDMGGPVGVRVSEDGRAAAIDVPLAGGGTDDVSNAALERLTDEVIPATVGAVPGAEVNVTGMTAGSRDFSDLMASRAPLVFAFVLGLAFLLLLVTFRSIVIAVKSIVLNLLGVAASYGVLVWIFQEGHLEGLLGFHANGGITAWLPLFLFVVLFGLSMDYHVFILSRIREGFDRGLGTERAISAGIKATASVVTSAAIVMVAVFSIFATLSMLEFKQMGVGLATAVLIDATIIRAVLLPAVMKLLGDWNWYLPRWLEWLPRFRHEPAVDEPARVEEAEEQERVPVAV